MMLQTFLSEVPRYMKHLQYRYIKLSKINVYFMLTVCELMMFVGSGSRGHSGVLQRVLHGGGRVSKETEAGSVLISVTARSVTLHTQVYLQPLLLVDLLCSRSG